MASLRDHSARLLCVGLGLALAACTETPVDGENDPFLIDGKTDTGGIAEGTPEAAAVLFVANSTSRADLVGEVGVAAKAADNIVAVRDGDDGAAGTADDEQFTTLAELDAVPFVGPVAFAALLEYARDNDLVGDVPVAADDPFDPNACSGAAMTHAQALSSLGTLGSYQIAFRKRTCVNGVCPDWTPAPVTYVDWPQDASGLIKLGNYGGEARLIAQSRTCDAILSNKTYIVGTVCDGVGHQLQCSTYDEPDECRPSSDNGLWVNGHGKFRFTGKLTNNCVQLTSKLSSSGGLPSTQGNTYEIEAAIFQRF